MELEELNVIFANPPMFDWFETNFIEFLFKIYLKNF